MVFPFVERTRGQGDSSSSGVMAKRGTVRPQSASATPEKNLRDFLTIKRGIELLEALVWQIAKGATQTHPRNRSALSIVLFTISAFSSLYHANTANATNVF